jgi:hypothetical protein
MEHPSQREAVLELVRAIARQASDEAFDRAQAHNEETDDKPSEGKH